MKSFSTYTISTEHAELTVEKYLKQIVQVSGRSIQRMTRQKGLVLNGKPTFLQRKLKPGDKLQIMITASNDCSLKPESGEVDILYEDKFIIVVNKPARQLVHPAGQTVSGTLVNYLAFQLKQRGIVGEIRAVHRLDRDTSGCVLFAKDPHSQFLLSKQLTAGVIHRTYWALVRGIVLSPSGTIDTPIGPHPSQPNRRAVNERGESAITHYRVLQTFSETTLLECKLETGRTHQIRVHLAHLGFPIIGDGMYGVRVAWMPRQALHASSISFRKINTEEELTIHAPLPTDFAKAIDFAKSSQFI